MLGGLLEHFRREAAVGFGGWGCAGAWIRCAHADPFFTGSDLRRFEFVAAGRHLEVGVVVADGADERAVVWFSGDDGRAGFAPLEPAVFGIEGESALLFS